VIKANLDSKIEQELQKKVSELNEILQAKDQELEDLRQALNDLRAAPPVIID
jgi:uncharacterized coiled-coil DUF342 family protein